MTITFDGPNSKRLAATQVKVKAVCRFTEVVSSPVNFDENDVQSFGVGRQMNGIHRLTGPVSEKA